MLVATATSITKHGNLSMETTLRNNTGNVVSKEVNTMQGYTMNGGIGAMYATPWIFYMYINRGPSAYLHSLISL